MPLSIPPTAPEVDVPTDILFDNQDLTLDAADARLHVKAADVLLASAERQKSAGLRRALVHSADDGIVVNFNSDYPAGVEIHGRVVLPGSLFVGTPHPDGPPAPGDNQVDADGNDVAPEVPMDPDPDVIFGDLNHPLPLNIVYELQILRRAVLRLHQRVTELESKG